ncbi:MAG: hypothetical protein WA803_04485 [Steroidobacteraceae bacterium]
MGRMDHRLLQCVAVLGLCGLSMSAALASPPSGPRGALRLDLHPSATTPPTQEPSDSFPSSLHPHPLKVQPPLQLPELGAEVTHSRIASRAEQFARRVHREGLPVARLWENKRLLVSLGLNDKGKPGLWLVQKIH